MKGIIKQIVATLGIFTCVQAHAWYSGWSGSWLLGASAGYASQTGSFGTQLNYTGALFPATFPQTHVVNDYSSSGFIWGFLFGYQAVSERWLLGGELNFDRHAFDQELDFAFSDAGGIIGWTGNATYKRHVIVGLSGRLGYALAPFFMPYVRLGVEVAEDRLRANYQGNPSAYPFSISATRTSFILRALSGFGFEIPLPMICNSSFRIEYNWHSKSKTLKSDGAIEDGLVSPAFEASLQPHTHSGRVALVWNFT